MQLHRDICRVCGSLYAGNTLRHFDSEMDVYEKISFVPVLFLTAKAQESDKLIGLMTGGDDYLMKPFSYSELLSRVKALVRRYRVYRGKEDTAQDNIYLEHSGIRIHGEFNEVYAQGKEMSLTDIEYHILRLMMKNTGRIFSVQMLYEQIWNEPYFYNCNSTVMVHIRKLRTKIEEDPLELQLIKTVWGRGDKFEKHMKTAKRWYLSMANINTGYIIISWLQNL